MTRLLILASMLFASAAFAQVEIPHVHENGDVIDADEINKNLDIVAKAVPPRDCSKDQIIKWDGSAWVCSSLTHVYKELSGVEGVIPCPAGKKVTGGGCDMDMAQCDQLSSVPLGFNGLGLPEFSAWYCSAGGSTGANDQCELNFGYAICQ